MGTPAPGWSERLIPPPPGMGKRSARVRVMLAKALHKLDACLSRRERRRRQAEAAAAHVAVGKDHEETDHPES